MVLGSGRRWGPNRAAVSWIWKVPAIASAVCGSVAKPLAECSIGISSLATRRFSRVQAGNEPDLLRDEGLPITAGTGDVFVTLTTELGKRFPDLRARECDMWFLRASTLYLESVELVSEP
jgi:hypothetical protein